MSFREQTKRCTRSCLILVLGALYGGAAPLLQAGTPERPLGSFKGPLIKSTENLISFEPNRGQAGNEVRFTARGPGYSLHLTYEGALFSFESGQHQAPQARRFALKLVGANRAARVAGKDELQTKSSYFPGTDPSKWHTEIPNYAAVKLENVYPGIDVTFEGTHGRLECLFKVRPGVKPGLLTLVISGAKEPRLDAEGNLLLPGEPATLELNKPTAYQDDGENTRAIHAQYVVDGSRITIAVGEHNRMKALMIDSVLNYASYLTTHNPLPSLEPRFASYDQHPAHGDHFENNQGHFDSSQTPLQSQRNHSNFGDTQP